MKAYTRIEKKNAGQMDDGLADDLDTAVRPDVAGLKGEPEHDDIARVAYEIFESEGCPSDRAEVHWFEAERRLKAGSAVPVS